MADPCIRCGHCAVVCPVDLQPQFLHASINAKAWERTEDLKLDACLFCHACTAACPSQINLREQFTEAALVVQELATQRLKSQAAKRRFEAREARLLKNKQLQEKLRAEKLKNLGISFDG
jgi:Na+-translocating ferredoxin:NAD+ oxidoreductase subunit C